jgi:hypothetical protein
MWQSHYHRVGNSMRKLPRFIVPQRTVLSLKIQYSLCRYALNLGVASASDRMTSQRVT